MPLTLDEMATTPKKRTLDEMALTPKPSFEEDKPFTDAGSLLSDETRNRMTNSVFYADLLGIDPAMAFDLHDALNKNYLGKEISPTAQPAKMFFDAFKQSLADKPAMMLRGVEVYTPGKAWGLDSALDRASTYLESLKDPVLEQKLNQVSRGKLWPIGENRRWWQVEKKYIPEVINAWSVNVGDQIPIMLSTLAGRLAGKVVGKQIGVVAGAAAALVTGGPDPSDVGTGPAVAAVTGEIVKHLGSAAPLVAMEAGGFVDAAEQYKIDPDITEHYAKYYGLGSGAIEYAQWLWVLGRYSKIAKPVQETILKQALSHIGGSIFEGVEEVSQEGLQNFLMRKAMVEMKSRHSDYAFEPSQITSDYKRVGAVASGIAFITGLPGTGMTMSQGRLTRVQQVKPETKKFLGEPSSQEITEAVKPAVTAPEIVAPEAVVGQPAAEPTVTAPAGIEAVVKPEAKVTEPPTEEELRNITRSKRTGLIKETEAEIAKNNAYQEMAGAQEYIAVRKQFGQIWVEPEVRTEVRDYIGTPGHEGYKAELAKQFTFDDSRRNVAMHWDEAAQELGVSGIDEVLEYVEMSLASEKGGIIESALTEAMKGDPSLEVASLKREALQRGLTPDDINDIIREWAKDNNVEVGQVEDQLVKISEAEYATGRQEILRRLEKEKGVSEREQAKRAKAAKTAEQVVKGEPTSDVLKKATAKAYETKQPVYVYPSALTAKGLWKISVTPPEKGEYTKVTPPAAGEIRGKVEKGYAGLTPEQEAKAKKLRHDIHAVAAVKGLSGKAFKELKRTVTKSGQAKSTLRMSMDELQALLKKVKSARPKRVGYQKVLTLRTERRIQTLKENLTSKGQMTEEAWKDILKRETGGREPKYIDAEHFINQEESREVLKRMHNVATLLKITNAYKDALSKDPEKLAYVNKLSSEVLAELRRDPWSWESMRWYAQQSQQRTGAPIYPVYKTMIDTLQENHRTEEAELKTIEAAVGEDSFAKITGDEDALQRVSDYIDSKGHLENKPEMPKDITEDEVKFARAIEKIWKGREIQSRLGKFFRWYEMDMPVAGEGAMADYERYKKEIQKAVQIYDTQGEEELVKYLETQDWGIIHSGYNAKELILRTIQLYPIAARTVGKGHIKISTAVEFQRQERNILQRLSSYMRQMDMLSSMSPLINTFIQLYEDNAQSFKDWNTVKANVELFLSELKQYTFEKNASVRLIKRLFAQSAQAILENSPSITLYNMVEGVAFGADKSIYFNPQNKPLTAEDQEFLETYVQQQRAMLEEYYFVNEKALPGLKGLNKWARKLSLTSRSDVFSRYHTFWAKINQVRRALQLSTLNAQVSAMKLKDYSKFEQEMAMGIWAEEGPDAMARFVAKLESDNIHGLYERSQRSPGEMGSGAIFTNLMNFPRMWSERIARNVYTLFDKEADFETQYRAAKTLLSAIVGGTVIGMGIGAITGRRRNPYNPFEIITWRFGGLSMASAQAVSDLWNVSLEIFSGDPITAKRAKSKWPTVFTALPAMFVPFYSQAIRAMEKMVGEKYIDRQALRWIGEQIDKDYHMRPDAYKFNKKGIIEAMQYIFIGRSTDVEETKKGKTTGTALGKD